MKTLFSSLRTLLPLLALLLAAGTAHAQHTPHKGHASKSKGHTTHSSQHNEGVKMVGGVQVVAITVGATGYAPEQIALKAGVPARLVFTRTADGGCLDQIQIPAFGVTATPLPLNKAVAFDVLPKENGTFTFACGMDMARGALLVKS